MDVDQERDFVGQLSGVAAAHITGQEFPEFGYQSLRGRAALCRKRPPEPLLTGPLSWGAC